MGGVSLADDYPHLFNMEINGNTVLSGGNCKIEGSLIVFIVNLILIIGFIIVNKKKQRN